MASKITELLTKRFPQNFIIKKPLIGTLILMGFFFCFIILYKPFHVRGARSFSFELTMVAYTSVNFIPLFSCLTLLKRSRFFSKENKWNLLKEIMSILIILIVMGITVYFAGFIIEVPADRWNLSTFFDSMKYPMMICMIPFMFFTISNYRYLFSPDILQFYNQPDNQFSLKPGEEIIHISSRLKKEELSFYPSHLLYAESDGNYVVFHLVEDNQHIKKTIRNSINEIEQQLSSVSCVMRTHRAFIVNLRKIISKKGNTLGYRLKLAGTDAEIPVSRNNTKNFDQQMKELR